MLAEKFFLILETLRSQGYSEGSPKPTPTAVRSSSAPHGTFRSSFRPRAASNYSIEFGGSASSGAANVGGLFDSLDRLTMLYGDQLFNSCYRGPLVRVFQLPQLTLARL
jgi:hypothetical protein